jgi:GDSL-like lipase/acylhydrolase family protein
MPVREIASSVRRRRWIPYALIVASVVVPLVACEAVLRVMNLYTPPPYPPQTTRGRLYEQFDPYGYRLRPSRAADYSYPPSNPRQMTMRSNKHGFRGRELDEPDDRVRVIVLGDSMVFGQGVEADERFTEVLESLAPRWRIDNLGMTGFGPDLMLRALEEVGLPLKPDIVLFCMYTDDFRRVHPQTAGIGFPIPRYALHSGHLTTVPYPKPHVWDRLHLSVLLRNVIWRFSGAEMALNQAILDRFLEHSKGHFTPALVFLPGTEDNAGDKKRRDWLHEYAVRTGTPFTDLTEPIHGAAERVFIRGDYHFSPAGHTVVARHLHRFIEDSVLTRR